MTKSFKRVLIILAIVVVLVVLAIILVPSLVLLPSIRSFGSVDQTASEYVYDSVGTFDGQTVSYELFDITLASDLELAKSIDSTENIAGSDFFKGENETNGIVVIYPNDLQSIFDNGEDSQKFRKLYEKNFGEYPMTYYDSAYSVLNATTEDINVFNSGSTQCFFAIATFKDMLLYDSTVSEFYFKSTDNANLIIYDFSNKCYVEVFDKANGNRNQTIIIKYDNDDFKWKAINSLK